MDIIFRVYNDGVAFRYLIKGPRGNVQCTKLTITDEKTEYRFAQSAEIWSIPWRTEYYEGIWTKRNLNDQMANGLDTLCSPISLAACRNTIWSILTHSVASRTCPAIGNARSSWTAR